MSRIEGTGRYYLTKRERVAAVASGALAALSIATPLIAAGTSHEGVHQNTGARHSIHIILQGDSVAVPTRHAHDPSLPLHPPKEFLDAINNADSKGGAVPTPRNTKTPIVY